MLLDKQEVYKTFVSTLHCALENGADLYVNERQKIRHYRVRSTEERRRGRRIPNHDFLLRELRTEIVLLGHTNLITGFWSPPAPFYSRPRGLCVCTDRIT